MSESIRLNVWHGEGEPDSPRHSQHEDAIVQLIQPLSNIVAHYFYTEHEREDALQEILARLIEKTPSYRGQAPFEHWAMAIASKSCLSILRYKKIRRFFSLHKIEHEEHPEPSPTPAGALEKNEDHKQLHKAIDQLNNANKELIVFCYIMNKSDGEVASILNIKDNTLRVRKHRAKQQLKAQLEAMGYEHG